MTLSHIFSILKFSGIKFFINESSNETTSSLNNSQHFPNFKVQIFYQYLIYPVLICIQKPDFSRRILK